MNGSTLRTTLQTRLNARSALSAIGTEVHRYPPGSRATVAPTIFFNEWAVSSEGLALDGAESDRTYTLSGEAYAFTTGGATDDDWDDAETTATTLVEELVNELEDDPTINGICSFAEVSTWSMSSVEFEESKRTAFVAEFTVSIRQVE
jgi:hypothetical protein